MEKVRETKEITIAQLVNMNCPDAVFEEVKYNFIQHYRVSDFSVVREAFKDFIDLYDGKYPGYRACNTRFHDKIHTTDALLAISRLIDGYNLSHPVLPAHGVALALIATILHDTGYIQSLRDTEGTGAKYTLNHVDRSIGFMQKYFKRRFSRNDAEACANMIRCTGLGHALSKIRFSSAQNRILGYMLGTADLLGQMASRTYLERLIFLYREFKEGNVKGYDGEYSLFQKTIQFYAVTKSRFEKDLGGVQRYIRAHLRKRYHIDKDLYITSIERQIRFLSEILKPNAGSYRDQLKRRVSR